MAFFNSKLRYGLCAAIDLASQSPSEACQSREIAARQNIPGPYLDQILASLKGAGIVRSVRGAGGGYSLARSPDRISVNDIVCALMRTDRLFAGVMDDSSANLPPVAWVVRNFEEAVEANLSDMLRSMTLADLLLRKSELDDSLSIMPAI